MGNDLSDDALIGHTVAGRFRCDELLGVGGMGRVYKATQISVNRSVALKVLRPEIGAQSEARERFMREAQTVAGIAHPGVVQLVDFGRDPDRDLLFLAMEFVEGVPLSSIMQLGRMRRSVALGIGRQIAAALAQAHRAGVVHRDLKPDNIMLVATADGALQVKVLDFGIALPSTEETRLTKSGAIVGTPHYMSPEQAQDLELTPASDLYSLGIIVFEMLAGRLPFEANTPLALLFKHVQAPPPNLGDIVSGVDPAVEAFVASLLAKTADERPAAASEVAASLAMLEKASGPISVNLEVGATRPDTFLPLVEVQRPTSEATDVFGATVDSSPTGAAQAETTDRDRSATSGGSSADAPDPSSPIAAPIVAPAGTSKDSGPGAGRLLGLLALLTVGLAGLAWVAFQQWSSPGETTAVTGDAEISREPVVAPTLASGPPSVAGLDARSKARSEVELALRRARQARREAKQEPSNEPSAATIDEAPDSVAEDLVTQIGPRADEVEIPDKTTARRATRKDPPRIPPPTDSDTLQRRIRAAGGTCTGDQKCQIDATEPPGHAVCKDESTCVARCPNGGCIQFCQDNATCWFSCEGGKCNRMVGPDADMTEFTD